MGGYILLRACAGICDSMFMLEMLTPYAQKYNRTIIWELILYTASDVNSIFDLSDYPVNVLYDTKLIDKITFSDIKPSCLKADIYAIPKQTGPNLFYIGEDLAQFDLNTNYSDSTLLVYYGAIGGSLTMKNIRFNKKLIDEYYRKIAKLPIKFDAIHLRATDHYNQKIEENLKEIREFVKDKKNVYLATDNMKYMESLSKEFPQIIKSFSYQKIVKRYYSLHHDFGTINPQLLKNAILDILICASSKEFLKSVGGFSRAIEYLHTNKCVLNTLLKQ
jgi:hypothetical protein